MDHGFEYTEKELRHHLNFGKCQSNDFDAQIADTTIVNLKICRTIIRELLKGAKLKKIDNLVKR